MGFFARFFSDVREYNCGPGRIRTVYRDVDKAFPLYLTNFDAQAKAATSAAQQLSAEASVAVKKDVAELLVKIDKYNSSAQQHFRAAYAVYAAAPCEKLEYLEEEVSKICANDAELRLIETHANNALRLIQINGGVGRANPNQEGEIIQIVRNLLLPVEGRKLVQQIGVAPKLVNDWKKDEQ